MHTPSFLMDDSDCSPCNIWLHQRKNRSACADLKREHNNHKASFDYFFFFFLEVHCQDEPFFFFLANQKFIIKEKNKTQIRRTVAKMFYIGNKSFYSPPLNTVLTWMFFHFVWFKSIKTAFH